MRLLTSIFIILLLLSGCSSKPSLELVSASVEIRDDRSGGIGITSGEKEGEVIKPISLSYDFVLKNTSKKTLGKAEKPNKQTYEYDDGIKVYIEPNEKLKAISKEIMGVNIFSFDEEGRQIAELGIGKTGVPIIEPNQEGKYTFDLILGANEENPELRVVPSSEQLEKLKQNAMDATLIVTIEDEEIARFDLSKSN
ncbi:hypothetical protein [Bacillus sp. T3]|uniref:hypothetical protein n=1 Tax=Bacillus sp. T3 TaxID=467262 RepID=UPI0029828FA0|nr:hypothetical protein [Bacillus sp. T3]